MKRLLLAGLAVVAVGIGYALAQNVQQQLNGSEAWQVGTGGPGGPGVYTNTKALRGGRTYASISNATYTTTISANIDIVIVSNSGTGTISISLPTAPFDGQDVRLACPGGTVTFSVNAPSNAAYNPGPTVTGSAFTGCSPTPTPSGFAEWVFSNTVSPATWLRVQ